MSFFAIAGTDLWTRSLFIITVPAVLIIIILPALYTVLYQHVLYSRLRRKRFGAADMPRCSIILPCKGIPKDFARNIAGFRSLDYPDYEIIFTVESEHDPAVPHIRELISTEPRASLVVAGLARTCSQKNWNLLAAIQQTGRSEVYVFADADILPHPQWLRNLVEPLAGSDCTVTTGFRWLVGERGTFAEHVHAYMNAFLYVLWTWFHRMGGVGLWGGSMAIRRADFEKLGVAGRWAETVVDDNSLSQIIMKNKKKSILVPTCLIRTGDLLGSVRHAVAWFERQMMFLKAYQHTHWTIAIFLITLGILLLAWSPLALLWASTSDRSFFELGGGTVAVFMAGNYGATILYRMLGPIHHFPVFFAVQPVLFSIFLYSCLKTVFTNTITWSGVIYRLTGFGRVAEIERPGREPHASTGDTGGQLCV